MHKNAHVSAITFFIASLKSFFNIEIKAGASKILLSYFFKMTILYMHLILRTARNTKKQKKMKILLHNKIPRIHYPKSRYKYHCWWTKQSSRAHVAKFYGWIRLILSVLRASKFYVFTIDYNCKCVCLLTIPFCFSSSLDILGAYLFNFLKNYFLFD